MVENLLQLSNLYVFPMISGGYGYHGGTREDFLKSETGITLFVKPVAFLLSMRWPLNTRCLKGFVECWVDIWKIQILASDITFVIYRFLISRAILDILWGQISNPAGIPISN